MTILEKVLIFYSVAGVIIGALVSSMDKISFTWSGNRPSRYPRSCAFFACLIMWPVFFWQLVFGRRA